MGNSGTAAKRRLLASSCRGSVLSGVLPRRAQPLVLPQSGISNFRPVTGGPAVPLLDGPFNLCYRPVQCLRRLCERHGPVAWAELIGRRVVLVDRGTMWREW